MTTATRTARYRTPALRGDALGVDRKAEVIRGVAVMQLGNINESDMRQHFVDATTFSQFLQMAGGRGLKGRFTHPDLSNDGLGSFLGRWKRARIDGETLRADLHISPRSHDSPKLGDVGKYVLDLAESDPDMFGASMATLLDEEAMERDRRSDGFQPIRLKQLYAIDIVDTPALTHNGLFSATADIPDQVSALLDTYFAGVQQTEIRERALGYLDRYLTNRYGVNPMSKDTTAPAALTQEALDSTLKSFGEKFSTDLLSKVDERITTALAKLDPKPTETELERKRCSELFATAKNAGLDGYEKIAQDAIDKGTTVEAFKASIADRLIGQNGLSKDAGDQPTDPEAKYKKEYAQNRAAFASMGLSETEYILSRKIDEGAELLVPGTAAA